MEFRILGPLRVSSDGVLVDLGPPAQRTLLAVLLACAGEPVTDDRLVDELWAADPPPSARHLLQVYVSRLRALLDEPPVGRRIVREGGGYVLRVRPGELDADRYAEAVAEAGVLVDRDPEAADRVLAAAGRLWHGPPFADLPDPPPAVQERAAHLERLHREAEGAWVDLRLARGRHRELLPELQGLVSQYPYDEALHAQLMLALYRCRRQADALQAGRALEARLRDDIGIDPASEIRDLYRDILLQAPHLDLEPPEPPGNLPTRLTSFVGRGGEIEEVTSLLEAARLVTLTGPGGIGKTRLALEVAGRLRSRFPGGTWWVDLASVSDPEMVIGQVAGILGLTSAAGSALPEAMARALRRRQALLLLDNCERVAAAVAVVAEGLLQSTTAPRMLVTSRTPLRVEGERLWPVPPLALPAPGGPWADVIDSDAVRLFVERGRAVSPAFALDPAGAAAVGDVCRRLDGLSLAIEMAAARLPVLTPQEIARRLDDRFALLELKATGPLTRHRTLEAAIEASHALLSVPERAMFERIAVFAGPFDLEAAGAVGLPDGGPATPGLDPAGGTLAIVTALVDASMLSAERDGERMRYRLLDTLREFGLGCLRRAGTLEDVQRVHARYHLDLAARAGVHLDTPAVAPWMARLSRDYAEVRQALGWSLEHEPIADTLRAMPALRELWLRRGDPGEAGRWTRWMLEADLAGVPPDLLSEAYSAASYSALAADEWDTAGSLIEESVRLARRGGSARTLHHALHWRASVAFSVGDWEALRRDSFEALEICDRAGDRWGRARHLTGLGFAALFGSASLTEARAWFEEARPLYRDLGDLGFYIPTVLGPLSTTAIKQGDLVAAERYSMEAVEVSSGTGWQAAALAIYSDVLDALGDHEAAEAAASRAIHIALEAGLVNWFWMAVRDLARAAASLGCVEEAALLVGASRRNLPVYGLDPAVFGPLEARCREGLGDRRVEDLVKEGAAMSHDELMDLLDSRMRPTAIVGGTPKEMPSVGLEAAEGGHGRR